MNEENKYRLYATQTTIDAIQYAKKSRFARITKQYTLIFTNGEKPENSVEITEKDGNRLTGEDKDWLLECYLQTVAAEIKEKEPEIAKRLEEKLKKLEEALREEKENLEGGSEDE